VPGGRDLAVRGLIDVVEIDVMAGREDIDEAMLIDEDEGRLIAELDLTCLGVSRCAAENAERRGEKESGREDSHFSNEQRFRCRPGNR